jgi:hypothetical protein
MDGLHIVMMRSGRGVPEVSDTVPVASRTHVPPSGRMEGGALQGAVASACSPASSPVDEASCPVAPASPVEPAREEEALHAVEAKARRSK